MSALSAAATALYAMARAAPGRATVIVYLAMRLVQAVQLPGAGAATFAAILLLRAVDLVWLAVRPAPSTPVRLPRGEVRRVAVIGAGASGITAAKCERHRQSSALSSVPRAMLLGRHWDVGAPGVLFGPGQLCGLLMMMIGSDRRVCCS